MNANTLVGLVVHYWDVDNDDRLRPYAAIVTDSQLEDESLNFNEVHLTQFCGGPAMVPTFHVAHSKQPKKGCWTEIPR